MFQGISWFSGGYILPETNILPLKTDGWKTIRLQDFHGGYNPQSEPVQTRINNTLANKNATTTKHTTPLKHKHNMHNVNKFTKTQKPKRTLLSDYMPYQKLPSS